MALEIKIGTEKAESALKRIEGGITSLEAALNRVSAGQTGIEAVLNQISTFRGMGTGAVSSVNSMSAAVQRLQQQTQNVAGIVQSIASLGNINVSATVTGVQSLVTALSRIVVPPALAVMAQQLGAISAVAPRAAASLQSVASAAASIPNVSGTLQQATAALNNKAQAAKTAQMNIAGLGTATSITTGLIAGFGLSLGGSGLALFAKSAYDAARTVDGFNTKMGLILGSSQQAAASLRVADQAAKDLALPLDVARAAWGKLATSMYSAGFEADDAVKVFRSFGTVFRTIGLDAEQMKRGFNAVDQAVSKGTINSEEFRQQLGELFPAINELATAMKQSPSELLAAMAKGTVSSRELIKMADHLTDKYGKALPTALNTLSATLTLTSNEWTKFSAEVGRGFDAAIPGLQALAAAMDSEAFRNFGTALGTVAGTALSALANAAAFAAENISVLGPVVITATLALGGLMAINFGVVVAGWIAPLFALNNIMAAGTAIATGYRTALLWVAALGGGGFTGLVVAVTGAAGAVWLLTEAFGPLRDALSWVWEQIKAVAEYFGIYQPVADGVAKVTEVVAEKFTWITQSAPAAAVGVKDLGNSAGYAHQKFDGLTTSVGHFNAEISIASSTSSALAAELDGLGVSSVDLDGGLNYVEGSSRRASNAMRDMSWSSDTLSGSLYGSSNAADTAAGSYDRAANSADRYASAVMAADRASSRSRGNGPALTGGMDGSGFDTNFDFSMRTSMFNTDSVFSSFAGGGISHAGTRSQSGKNRWFNPSTPHFKSGGTTEGRPTVSGGGIPAILHRNEAVVPLAGGGAIPIAGGTFSGPMAETLVDLTRSTSTETSRVWEQVRALSMITQAGIDRHAGLLEDLGTRIANLSSTLINMNRSTGGSSSSGGSSGVPSNLAGGSANAGDGSTVYGMSPAAFAALKPSERSKVISNWWKGQGVAFSGIGGVGGPGMFELVDGKVKAKDFVGARMGSPNMGRDMPAYASGTPNTSADAYGGFLARLHPDEAVIPLPDGRSVPVSFSNTFIDRMVDMMRPVRQPEREEARETPRQEAQRPTIVVHMTVNAKDADSFRRSQTQIIQELQGKLNQVQRNVGSTPRTYDPTKRTT